MKPLLHFFVLGTLICLQGCSGCIKKSGGSTQTSKSGKSKFPVPDATTNLIIKDEKDLTGYWAGIFGPDKADSLEEDGDYESGYNKINISLDHIDGDQVEGHIVIQGKLRPFKCNMIKSGSKYRFSFKGVSDEKSTGTYTVSIAKGDSLLTGHWSGGDKVPSHDFALTKKLFNYNPDWKLEESSYIDWSKSKKINIKPDSGETYTDARYATTSAEVQKYNPSTDVLTTKYLANLKKADLLILRNSIFARHGYTFKKSRLSWYFSEQSWYVPISNDVTAELTPIEKQNLKMMAPYEKYAQEFYDAFGR
ncbi:YARHG domain-containing protein [Mucilaginibacter sp. BT774]|uniref:YARHG domain-containing protein n=1 Tax=Mucilaginibacter sp. BT774 TaxID=3062276 RepID=UPI002674623E|nr:YARHG domain-containing protein [Mucilaginibacter sp. BT774]MDO3625427.1 YARHG domain-containing protein [Mucilaginibacter sp. BT774]